MGVSDLAQSIYKKRPKTRSEWSLLLLKPTIIILLIIAIALLIVYKPKLSKNKIKANFSTNSKYAQELNLFKSLSTKEQEQYLSLSKNDKLVKYNQQLN